MEYENDLCINKHHLDEEWLRQPMLYQQYSELLAEAEAAKGEAQAKLDYIRAKLDSEIRGNPSEFGLLKATEGAIEATIQTQDEYRKAVAETIETKKNLKIIEGVVRAMDHKKNALEDLVQLWLRGYWSEPSVKTEVKDKLIERSKEKQDEALKNNERMMKRRKGEN
jgi:hypothetical protein